MKTFPCWLPRLIGSSPSFPDLIRRRNCRTTLRTILEASRLTYGCSGPAARAAGTESGRPVPEYNRYARTICRYLKEGADEFRLMAYLAQVQTVSMGLSRADEERDKLIAKRLMALSE